MSSPSDNRFEGLQLSTFAGDLPNVVLILAGIHASELGGIEVAHWTRVKLTARSKKTRYTAVIVPEIFPERARAARAAQWKSGKLSPDDGVVSSFREIPLNLDMSKPSPIGTPAIKPARQFPPPGLPLSSLEKGFLLGGDGKTNLKDSATGRPIPLLAEIRALTLLIEKLNPIRIISVHGKQPPDKEKLQGFIDKVPLTPQEKEARQKDLAAWDGKTPIKWGNWPGIFVDPRYTPDGPDLEAAKFDKASDPAFVHDATRFDTAKGEKKDDQLALELAKAVKDKSLTVGNHLDSPPEKVHYAKEPGTSVGYSLGDWGPVSVKTQGNVPGDRAGAPVFTFEVAHYPESWAFYDGMQVMNEDGVKSVSRPLTPKERAAGILSIPYARPELFNRDRSAQLQAYAEAIISVGLEMD